MLGRKNYTPDEIEHAKASADQALTAYRELAIAAETAALTAFEPQFFNNMVLVLDRYFVHRIRAVAGKDGNPLNEVELIADAVINNDGIFQSNNVIKWRPDESVLKLNAGDPIRLTATQFEALAKAFFAELEAKFL
jgi:hypothetical protein